MLNLIHEMVLKSDRTCKRCLGQEGLFFSGLALATSQALVPSEAVGCVNLLISFATLGWGDESSGKGLGV